ncbi:astacin-like metalloendopeptidase [Rana temporaria]|uniref:astacin-like metalloendopeptidase n=1 Tax=Rana temporaria TaxID=8407 RepID=UPI001AADFDBA|nr:astacin-like metalloendopeptidase [Rana temporaria]
MAAITDADKTTFDDDDWTISDQIAQANEGSPVFLSNSDIGLKNQRSALICASCQWRKSNQGIAIVPYVISSNYTDTSRDFITSAMLEFTTMTCVHFQNRTTEPNYLSFEDKGGCWSSIGKVNGRQTVSIEEDSCMNYGVIQHEIMHSLGFDHEHIRTDRDNYVAINWQYISKGK